MHLFDLSQFLQDSFNRNCKVICTKIVISEGLPSTRWGHSATSYKGKLYIMGGRNDHDVNDLHEFDPQTSEWKAI